MKTMILKNKEWLKIRGPGIADFLKKWRMISRRDKTEWICYGRPEADDMEFYQGAPFMDRIRECWSK